MPVDIAVQGSLDTFSDATRSSSALRSAMFDDEPPRHRVRNQMPRAAARNEKITDDGILELPFDLLPEWPGTEEWIESLANEKLQGFA